MRIERAIERDSYLEVWIDGHRLTTATKYTFLEWGYAVYLLDEPDEHWLKKNGDTVPPDPADSRAALTSGGGALITADPILVALAYKSWWSRNGEPRPQHQPLPIPLLREAITIVRHRRILNDFNKKWAGTVPDLAGLYDERGKHRRSRTSRQQE
jgi:hypothetical protein